MQQFGEQASPGAKAVVFEIVSRFEHFFVIRHSGAASAKKSTFISSKCAACRYLHADFRF